MNRCRADSFDHRDSDQPGRGTLDEQTHIGALLTSSVFFSCFHIFHPESKEFESINWTTVYITVFLVWILFSSLNFLYAVAFWEVLIFGRIRPIHEEENVSLAPTWMNLIKIAEVCTQEQKYDEIGTSSWISNMSIRMHGFCKFLSKNTIKGAFCICRAIRKNSNRQRQIAFRFGVFESGEPLPA